MSSCSPGESHSSITPTSWSGPLRHRAGACVEGRGLLASFLCAACRRPIQNQSRTAPATPPSAPTPHLFRTFQSRPPQISDFQAASVRVSSLRDPPRARVARRSFDARSPSARAPLERARTALARPRPRFSARRRPGGRMRSPNRGLGRPLRFSRVRLWTGTRRGLFMLSSLVRVWDGQRSVAHRPSPAPAARVHTHRGSRAACVPVAYVLPCTRSQGRLRICLHTAAHRLSSRCFRLPLATAASQARGRHYDSMFPPSLRPRATRNAAARELRPAALRPTPHASRGERHLSKISDASLSISRLFSDSIGAGYVGTNTRRAGLQSGSIRAHRWLVVDGVIKQRSQTYGHVHLRPACIGALGAAAVSNRVVPRRS